MPLGDGVYIVADGGSINPNYEQIEPGIYQSDGEAVFGATYQVFGGFGNLLYQGAGLFGPVTIVIPRMAWAFQTTGMEPWTRIADPPTLWLRKPDETWFNLTDPQPGAPANLVTGYYNPWQLRLRLDGPQWFYQANSFRPLHIRMPDGYWIQVAQFGTITDLQFPPNIDPGFMIGILPYGVDSTEVDTSKPVWFEHLTTLGSPVFGGLPLQQGVHSEVENHPTQGLLFDIRREYISVDLDLVRWASRALDPDDQFTLSIRFVASVSSYSIIDGNQVGGDWGEMVLATADGSVVDTDTFPVEPTSNSFRVPGNYVPRISLTGEPSSGTALHTFDETGSPTPQYYDYAIDLGSLDGVRSLEFEFIPVTPDTPDTGDIAHADGGASVFLAFNP
jgi:hypothetical protein